jgi:hypothetical protein
VVVVVGSVVVVVVVVVELVDVVVVVVSNGMSKEFVHNTLFDLILTIVVKSGTKALAYPANKETLDTPVSKAEVYPSESENKSKGPVSAPAVVNVINAVIIYNLRSATSI